MLPPHDSRLIELLAVLLHVSVRLLGWLVTYAVHSTVLIGATWLLTGSPLGRRFRLGQSALLWRCALLGGLATASLSAFGGRVPSGAAIRVGSSLVPEAVRVLVTTTADVQPGQQLRLVTHVVAGPLWPVVVVLLWLAGGVICFALLLLAHRRFMSTLGDRWDGSGTVAGGALREVMRHANVRREISLRVASSLTSPVAVGRGEICLPQRALAEFDPEDLEGILAHELAHLERRDAFWLLIARLVETLCFFQPLNRLARHRMTEASEFAADAWAVRVTAKPVVLARCLARVAEWASHDRALFAPAMAEQRASSFVRRVRLLTGAERMAEPPRVPVAAALLALAVLGALAPGATIGAPARSALGQRMMMIRVDEHRVNAAGRLDADSALVFVRRLQPSIRLAE